MPKLSRRTFLFASGLACGGFLVGCGDASRQQLRRGKLPLTAGELALNGWLKTDTEGRVTVMMPRSEMGQGVHTALLMLVAEELDCGWERLQLGQAPVDRLYGNVASMAEGVPFRPDDAGVLARSARWTMVQIARGLGLMVTGGSSSIRDLWQPLREAAAVTRATLLEVVAREHRLEAAEISLRAGNFIHGERVLASLGEAVRLAGPSVQPATRYQLTPASAFRVIGHPFPRREARAKTVGHAKFGIDVRRPGMLYAAIRFAPTRGAEVETFDAAKAASLPGVRGVLRLAAERGGTGGIAVVADQYWQAQQALAAVEARFAAGPCADFSTPGAEVALAELLASESGFVYWRAGDVDAALAGSARRLEAEYHAPWLAHTPMEPPNCTVEFRGDSATVWAPTQVPGFARRAAADALDLEPEQVTVEVTLLGGAFGRRLESDVIWQAATIARQFPDRPVQLIWSREDDLRHDFYRPGYLSRFVAGLDAEGRIVAWQNQVAGQSITPAFLARNLGVPGAGPDKTSAEGAFDQAYEFPAARVAHVAADLALPVGYWRAVGHSQHAFFKESFLDECAHAAGADPLEYRLRLLANHPREQAVLQLAATKAGWRGTRIEAGRAMGIALHASFDSVVAQVAEVSVAEGGEIRVHRVVAAIDCGIAVNPNLIAQQVESGVVFGLSAALWGKVDVEGGTVAQSNFHDYPMLRLPACPRIETHLVASEHAPGGVGEPGLPPIAPAIANALFVLTGQRLRRLPLRLSS